MILDRNAQPVPPSDITRRLADIHPRLGVRVMKLPGEEGAYHWWAFTLAWAKEDPRWAMVQRGDMKEEDALDIIGQLPRDAGVEEAYGYFVQSARAIQGQADKEAILSRAERWLKDPFEQAKQEQADLVQEDAERLFRGHHVSTPQRAAKADAATGWKNLQPPDRSRKGRGKAKRGAE